jgi:diguanylate cyclase (GGDEF)-like protein/PAS domain S-box-containing protein
MLQPAQNTTHRDPRSLAPQSTATHRRRMIRILVANDNAADVEVWLQELKRAQFAVFAEVVQSPDSFVERLGTRSYDIVLGFNSMRDWTGLQMLESFRQQNQDIPFLLVVNEIEEPAVDEFIRKGATDCVDRNRPARLPVAVALALEQRSTRAEQNRVETELRHSEAHYRALAENPAYGICRIDLDGRFLDVNEALVKMLGYASREELMAANLAEDIIRDPLERAQLFDPYRQTGSIHGIEMEWKRRDGTAMKARLSGRGVGPEKEAPEGCEIIAEDVTAQRAAEDHFRHLAATDALTGLANYRKLAETLDAEIERSKRTGRSFAVLAFDLNGLKKINDSHGHLAGNQALCRLAHVFRFSCRSIDTAARCGGDEFAIVLPETGAREGELAGRRICECLANDKEEPRLSVSFGVGVYPEDGPSVGALLQTADRALYKMKGQ